MSEIGPVPHCCAPERRVRVTHAVAEGGGNLPQRAPDFQAAVRFPEGDGFLDDRHWLIVSSVTVRGSQSPKIGLSASSPATSLHGCGVPSEAAHMHPPAVVKSVA